MSARNNARAAFYARSTPSPAMRVQHPRNTSNGTKARNALQVALPPIKTTTLTGALTGTPKRSVNT